MVIIFLESQVYETCRPFSAMRPGAMHSARNLNRETMMKELTVLSAVRKARKSKPQGTPPSLPAQAPAWAGDLDVHALKGELKGEPLFAALQTALHTGLLVPTSATLHTGACPLLLPRRRDAPLHPFSDAGHAR